MKEFCHLYKKSRIYLVDCLKKTNKNKYSTEILINKAQKLMDRIIFICFAEKLGILEPGLLDGVLQSDHKWSELKKVFKNLKKNNKWPFSYDRVLCDLDLKIENHFFDYVAAIYFYEFEGEPDFDIMGKIFEDSSISLSERKNHGIYFTPSYLTRFILDHTVGNYLTKNLEDSCNNIKVLDPACGAGVFLNQAFEYLLDNLNDVDRQTIIKNNIFGVDLNEELVKLARLSLLLKSASKANEKNKINFLRKLDELTHNIKCGDSIIDDKKIAGEKAFLWEKEFSDPSFDVIIGNPPWGANVDLCSPWLTVKYPDSTRLHKDTYKLFIDRSLFLLRKGGYLGFVVPNSFLYQPGYSDIKELLGRYSYTVINLGDGIFEGVCLPAAVLFVKKVPSSSYICEPDKVIDLTGVSRELLPRVLHKMDLESFNERKSFNDNKIINEQIARNKNLLTIDDVFNLRDAGVQYASVGAGKKNKGKSDLPGRLFSDKKGEIYNIPLYKGSNIKKEGWLINHDINTWLRKSPLEVLKKNEWVRYGKDIFRRKDKIVWRQTSDKIRAAIMDFEGYFSKSLHAAVPGDAYKSKINLNYALAVFNSRYINYIYQQKVMERGRVFPQVKLCYLKSLPFVIPPLEVQKEIEAKVIKLKGLYERVYQKEKISFFDLVPAHNSEFDGTTFGYAIKTVIPSENIKIMYEGRLKKLRKLLVEECNGYYKISTLNSKKVWTELLSLKCLLKKNSSKENYQMFYQMLYFKYYLENLPSAIMDESNKEPNGIMDKLFNLKIVGYDDENIVKTTVGRWTAIKKDIDDSKELIQELENKINQKIYDIYGLNKFEQKQIEDFHKNFS